MFNTAVEIKLNSITSIPFDEIKEFNLTSSIANCIPYGYFLLKDSAEYIHSFENLQIGSTVDITFKNMQDAKDSISFPTFNILKIEDGFENNFNQFSGLIKIWFGHPWYLFKDDKNHAYNPLNHSKLIKHILEDENRGLKFKINNKRWEKTDDSGKYSRYKTGETDFDFIHSKVLPYTTINKLPALFYYNLTKEEQDDKFQGKFELTNSLSLYNNNSKILFTPSQEALEDVGIAPLLSKLLKESNLDGNKAISISSASITIVDSIKELVSSSFVEYIKSMKISNKVKIKLKNFEGSSFGNLMPLDEVILNKLGSTSVSLIKNKRIDDAMALILSKTKSLYNIFTLKITSNFCDSITLGDTVEMFTPLLPKNRISWIKGKWLTIGYEINVKDNKATSSFTLGRPSFVGDINTTSLSMYQTLHEA